VAQEERNEERQITTEHAEDGRTWLATAAAAASQGKQTNKKDKKKSFWHGAFSFEISSQIFKSTLFH